MPTFQLEADVIPDTSAFHQAFQHDGETLLDYPNGFGKAEHWAFEQDAAEPWRYIPLAGPTTEVWYVTDAARGHSTASIAAAEGIAESVVTTAWILGQDKYGRRSTHPLAWDDGAGGAGLGRTVYTNQMVQSQRTTVFRALWWLFEAGAPAPYPFSLRITSGESAMHPVMHGAFGSGARPDFAEAPFTSGGDGTPKWNLYAGVKMPGYANTGGPVGTMWSDCELHQSKTSISATPSMYTTWHGTTVWDVHLEQPKNATWADGDRTSGLFFGSGARHVLISMSWLDLCGWERGYSLTGDAAFPHPPSDKNHNIYCTENVEDVTFVESLSTRGSHNSVQLRGGGFLGPSIHGESQTGCFHGDAGRSYETDTEVNFTKDDVVSGLTSGAVSPPLLGGTTYKTAFRVRPPLLESETQFIVPKDGQPGEHVDASVSGANGEILSVADNGNYGQTIDVLTISCANRQGHLTRNRVKAFSGIEEHLAVHDGIYIFNGVDPHNPAELAAKSGHLTGGDPGINFDENGKIHESFYTGDVVIYGWGPEGNNRGIEGLDPADLEKITFGGFVDDLLSQPIGTTSTDAALDYMRTLTGPQALFKQVWNYAAPHFGRPTYGHAASTIIFDPATYAPYSDGYRGDNPKNWRVNGKRDWPVDGDNLVLKALCGWYRTVRADDINFNGAAAGVESSGGYMSCVTAQGAGTIRLFLSGQFEFKGTCAADLTCDVSGGRLGVSGAITGGVTVDLTEEGSFVVYQGAAATFDSADRLSITGGKARVGFDGQGGVGLMRFLSGSNLVFAADDDGMATIQEFRTGKYGLEDLGSGETGQPLDPNLTSQVVLEAGANVTADTTGLPSGAYVLIDVDTLTDNGANLSSGLSVQGNRLLVEVS
ncbi:hypothetical protein [Tropicimonas sp. S265A]|uniref:hypothetical protein n=1 Tax=Tropicimonas sp. S265A TaxID=3415134 RepID=UPI003C7D3E70